LDTGVLVLGGLEGETKGDTGLGGHTDPAHNEVTICEESPEKKEGGFPVKKEGLWTGIVAQLVEYLTNKC
jgi:hypothetical protein